MKIYRENFIPLFLCFSLSLFFFLLFVNRKTFPKDSLPLRNELRDLFQFCCLHENFLFLYTRLLSLCISLSYCTYYCLLSSSSSLARSRLVQLQDGNLIILPNSQQQWQASSFFHKLFYINEFSSSGLHQCLPLCCCLRIRRRRKNFSHSLQLNFMRTKLILLLPNNGLESVCKRSDTKTITNEGGTDNGTLKKSSSIHLT